MRVTNAANPPFRALELRAGVRGLVREYACPPHPREGRGPALWQDRLQRCLEVAERCLKVWQPAFRLL